MLTDEAATVTGISNALGAFIKAPEVKRGDIIFIHVSSHGEQVEDDNGDESDGLDESIVTYNAVAPERSIDFSQVQANYFRDDLFGSYINQLRNKLGKDGDIMVSIDACHSGSGTRGFSKVRGGKPPLVSHEFAKKNVAKTDTSGLFLEGNARGNEKDLASYVIFSASRAEELDYETEGMGSLAYAISKVFSNLEPASTYRSVFSKVEAVMNAKVPGQHPVLEGDGIDRLIFGGKFISQKPYVQVESIHGKTVILKGGLFSGLDSGAKISLFPAGTVDPSHRNALSSGVVVKADNYSAAAQLDWEISMTGSDPGWAFITEPVFRIKPICIQINKASGKASGFSEVEIRKIREAFHDMPLVTFQAQPQLILKKGKTIDSIKIAGNGYLFQTVKDAGAAPDELKNAVKKYAQYKFLQELEVKDPAANVEIKLVPSLNGRADTNKIYTKVVNGRYEFSAGDTFVIWAKNVGNTAVYLNVIDIQPDGLVNPILPYRARGIYKEDLRIEPNSVRLFTELSIGPPYGTETLKIFVSSQQIDMEQITNSRGSGPSGNFTVLEKLVKDSYNVSFRGVSVEKIGNVNGTAFNIMFEIKPP